MAQEESAGSARDGTHRPRSFVHQDSDEHSPDTGADQLPAVIARLPKNADEEVRVTLDEYRGHHLVDVRIFADFTAANVPMPTKKGISIRVGQLPDLIEALRDAETRARQLGLLHEEA